jgi:hypothetical protein
MNITIAMPNRCATERIWLGDWQDRDSSQGFGAIFEDENYTLRTGHCDSRMIVYPIK